MNIIGMTGLIKRRMISEKLGIYIDNISEMNYYKNISIRHDFVKSYDMNSDEYNQYLEYQIKRVIEIDVIEETEIYLKYKNPYSNTPSCEDNYSKKVVQWLDFMSNNLSDDYYYGKNIPYFLTVEKQIKRLKLFMNWREAGIKEFLQTEPRTDFKSYEDLFHYGKLIDDYLESKEDFLKLDYIIENLYQEKQYTLPHFMKMVSLLEMLLVNPKKKTDSIENKLPQLLSEETYGSMDRRKRLCTLFKRIRNKVAHWDPNKLNDYLEQYASEFMKDFDFDYHELSRDVWIVSSLCCKAHEIIACLVLMELKDKEKLRKIKFS